MALLRVGMSELKVGGKGDRLQALGLGSCIGLAFFDTMNHIGGMVHVMLPDSSIRSDMSLPPGKFADTGVPALLDEVIKAGAVKSRLVVKMAGGAEMFSFARSDSPHLAVGQRNAKAVLEELEKIKLRVKAKDVGGNHGRTFEVDLDTLACTIKVVGKGIHEL